MRHVRICVDGYRGSGINRTVYELDGVEELTYAGPFIISKGGPHTIRFMSYDNLGFANVKRTQTLVVDIWTPTTKANKPFAPISSDLVIEFSGSDFESGFKETFYRVTKQGNPAMGFKSGANVTIETAPDNSKDGKYIVDRHGNVRYELS